MRMMPVISTSTTRGSNAVVDVASCVSDDNVSHLNDKGFQRGCRRGQLCVSRPAVCHPASCVSPGQLCVPRPWASDDDQSVVQAAVTVLSELAMHNPKTYLPLAPKVGQCRLTLSNPS